MSQYVGIDPGLGGGLVLIREGLAHRGLEVVIVAAMPTLRTGKGNRRAYDVTAILAWLRACDATLVILEKQQAYPNQGGVSNFTTGYGFGMLDGVLQALALPYQIVRPRAWQKVFGISGAAGDTKAQAAAVCGRLFPGVSLLATERCRVPHTGITDALLLAEFGRRQG